MPKTQTAPKGLLSLVVLTALALPASGGAVPTGYQEYFVIGYEQHIYGMMDRVRLAEGTAGGGFANINNSVVSFVASSEGQRVYYDQWEDGLEADILNPVAASTLVFGDGVNGNGRACDWSSDPRIVCGTATEDQLFAGSLLTLDSRTATGVAPCTTDTRRCAVPVNPRNPADVRFDGGDYVVTSGGPVSIIHSQDPQNNFVGGSTEMISRQAVANATAYYIPVGEDSYLNNGGAGGNYEPFQYVDIQLVSYADGTQVLIESPGAGSVAFQLNRGQHYSSRGFIDNTASPGITINAGTKVSTSGPIGGMIFSAGNGTYLTDFYALLPDLLHSTDYVLATSGDNPGIGGAEPLNIYVFNPDPVNSLSVRFTDTVGTGTGTVAPGAVRDYQSLAGRYVPNGSTVRLTSNRNFWGVSAHDHKTVVSDWGYSWLARRFLTDTYTVAYAPGVTDPPTRFTVANRTANDADCTATGGAGTPPNVPTTVGACNSQNRSPVWISAVVDNTRVKVDFDNDGTYDFVDRDGDDCPDNGQFTDASCAVSTTVCGVTLNACVYEVDALQSLKVFDQTDYDNTGTFITTNKVVAMAYGQDPDRGVINDPSVDSGYVLFPISQSFLDPVLTLDKEGDKTSVPTGGTDAERTVRYTLTLKTWEFGPITGLQIFDELPPTVPGSAYVAGSTRITFPDLTQSLADPVASTVGGRDRLTWTLSPDQMDVNQTLTIEYSVVIPAGGIALLENRSEAEGTYGGSVFRPSDTYDVVRTDVVLTKASTDDGVLESGDTLTFTISVENTGVTNETNVVITDPIPPDTVFCVAANDPPPCSAASTIGNAGPFTGTYERDQNAIVWTAANFGANTGPFDLSFTVRVNPGVPVGTVVRNRADYESTQTPNFESNEVQPVVVGPALVVTKTRTSGGAVVHPGEVVTYDLLISNQGTGAATNVVVEDPILGGLAYVPGSLSLRSNSGPFAAQTDAADADSAEYDSLANEVRGTIAILGAGNQATLRLRAMVTGLNGEFASNTCTAYAANVNPVACNLAQDTIEGNATVTGFVWLDENADGNFDVGEPPLPDVSLTITDVNGVAFEVVTDSAGNYSAGVPAGLTDVDVVDTDPDIPSAAVLTTANATQLDLNAIANATTAFQDIGYDPPAMSVSKTSSAGSLGLAPGETVTYTIRVDNYTSAPLTNVDVTDTLPSGLTWVSTDVTNVTPGTGTVFRVTEYCVGANTATCTPGNVGGWDTTTPVLTLNQNLAADYFVLIRGSAGTGGTTGNTAPRVDYLALDRAPAGSTGVRAGDLTGSVASNQLGFVRGNAATTWAGVITVVECLNDCDVNGFRLRDVQRIGHPTGGGSGGGTVAAVTGWNDINQAMLVGGYRGAGCDTTEAEFQDHKICQARYWPTGTNTINWSRNTADMSGLDGTTNSTVMVVEWGSGWTVQRRNVTGDNGGNGVNAAGEYNTAAISSVARANTWVWGVGTTGQAGIGENGEAAVVTLGDGVATNANEALLAVGLDSVSLNNNVDFEVYALTHPGLAVDYQFKVEGNGTATTFAETVAAATDPTARMALVYNSHNNPTGATAGNQDYQYAYPRPMFSARYDTNTTVRLERRRDAFNDANGGWAAWTQGIDFSQVNVPTSSTTNPGFAPPGVAANETIQAGGYLLVTVTATVDPGLSSSITTISNTATVTATGQPPTNGTVGDNVVRPLVDLEYNNADFALAGQGKVYQHIVYNVGAVADSYTLTAVGDLGWVVELLDPVTLGVIARDTNADGTWDGQAPNTGSLAPGEYREYLLRVNVPGGATTGTEHSVTLTATSNRSPSITDTATDETTILATSGDFTPVMFLPDNSGVVRAGEKTWYAHRVFNNTGATDTFDIAVSSEQGWTTAFYYDSNGDGVYTDGVDIEINNTAAIPDGGSQVVYVVTTAPPGATVGTRDVAHVTVVSRNDDSLFAAGTDTTTVIDQLLQLDLSGGGTRLVEPGVTGYAIYQGTVLNPLPIADDYDFTIGAALAMGWDALDHPTELWIDTNADGAADLLIATDDQGDGTWDTIVPAYDNGGVPRVTGVAAAGELAYELRRFVDPAFEQQRDAVTLQARSVQTADADNVTATMTLAAVTHAPIAGVRVDAASGIVEFATRFQRRTRGFDLFASDGRHGRRQLNTELIAAGRPNAMLPTLYRFTAAEPITETHLLLEELEVTGRRLATGPFPIGDRRLMRSIVELIEDLDAAGVPSGEVRELPRSAQDAHGQKARDRHAVRMKRFDRKLDGARSRGEGHMAEHHGKRRSRELFAVTVSGTGPITLTAADLPAGWSTRRLEVFRQGQPVPVERTAGQVRFQAVGVDTDFTNHDVYVISQGPRPRVPAAKLTRSAPAAPVGAVRHGRQNYYVGSLADGNDPWVWDYILAGSWPWEASWGQFDVPGLRPAAGGSVRVEVRVVGDAEDDHRVSGTLNGYSLGTLEFHGRTGAVLAADVPASALTTSANQLALDYASGLDGSGLAIDSVTLSGPAVQPPADATVVSILPYDVNLEVSPKTDYLIVTHPDFVAEAERLATHKGSLGHRTAVVTTREAYDRFAGGLVDPAAIRGLVKEVWSKGRGRLRYVLLVGDDDLDPRNFTGAGGNAFVPSLSVHDGVFGRVPSENGFADPSGDGLPDVAIGRLPVQTAADAVVMVDKVIAQQGVIGASLNRHVIASDNDASDDTAFDALADELESRLSAGSTATRVRLASGAAAARSALFTGWRSGASMVHYFGHGGVDLWADEQLLSLDLVADLAPAPPAVVFTWGCSSQWFQWLYTPSINEALLLLPESGAMATFGSAGMSTPVAQFELSSRVYQQLATPQIALGEAIRLAKRDAMTAAPALRRTIEGFTLLGDPALRFVPNP